MNKIIRWQGLAAFFVIVIAIAVLVLVFLNTWLRIGIEQGVGRLLGAEVNIERVEHRFSPFGLSLYGVQVTDPAKPTHNRVQLAEISADIELLPLLMDRIIIDVLNARELAFDQPRAREGRLYRSARDNMQERGFEFSISAPSVDEVLERSPLRTTRAITDAQAAWEQHEENLRSAYDNLPDPDSLTAYRQRLEALQETDYRNPADLLAARGEFQSILDELRVERQRLQDFRTAAANARSELGTQMTALGNAPDEDFQLLRGLLAGDAAAFSEVTEAVFGPQMRAWSENLFAAYELLAPLLASKQEADAQRQRAEGRWIIYDDTRPWPAFLVRNADISLSWDEQSFSSEWQNITAEHEILGLPTTFRVDSGNTPRWQQLSVDGEFRFLTSGLQASQRWNLAGVSLQDVSLSASESLAARMQSALLNSSGSLSINDDLLDGSAQVNLSSMALSAEGSNRITNLIADSLAALSSLQISADIGGLYTSPDFSLRSDLDRQLAGALAASISPADQARLDELRQRLDVMSRDPLTEGNARLAQWQSWDNLAEGSLGRVQDMLGMSLDNVVGDPVDNLRERLGRQLFGN